MTEHDEDELDPDISAEDVEIALSFLNEMHSTEEGTYQITDKGVAWALGWLGSLLRTDRLLIDEGDQGFIVALQIVADEAVDRGLLGREDIPFEDETEQMRDAFNKEWESITDNLKLHDEWREDE